jgi:hypothetical protein
VCIATQELYFGSSRSSYFDLKKSGVAASQDGRELGQ